MAKFEYKVVPAPKKGLKSKGLKTTEDRFAHAMASTMNELGAEGWEYLRADTLPCEEREGLMGRTTNFQNMLVFRRVLAEEPVVTADETADEHVAEALDQPIQPALIADQREDVRPEPPVTTPPKSSDEKSSLAAE